MSDLSAKNDDARAAPSPTVCPNCGNVRPSPFCPECGQNDRNYARGLGTVVWEFGREAFEMDSRFLQTLKLLLFKPGSLTNEFSRNRRARYMSPIRLYLFTSFLFVLVLSFAMPDSWSEGAAMMGSDSEEVPGEILVPAGGSTESLPVDGQVRDGDSRESPPVVGEATDDDADESPQLAGQPPPSASTVSEGCSGGASCRERSSRRRAASACSSAARRQSARASSSEMRVSSWLMGSWRGIDRRENIHHS